MNKQQGQAGNGLQMACGALRAALLERKSRDEVQEKGTVTSR